MKSQMSFLRIIKKIARKNKLETWQNLGRIKSKSWSGKKTAKEDRRSCKKDLKKEY